MITKAPQLSIQLISPASGDNVTSLPLGRQMGYFPFN